MSKRVLLWRKNLVDMAQLPVSIWGGSRDNLNQQGGNNNSGVHWGGGSGHGNNGGQGNSNSSNSTSTVMKPGESYLTPWGDVVINKDGRPVMNGVVMTEDNSSVMTSIDRSFW